MTLFLRIGLLILLVGVGSSRAEILEIPLNELEGTYSEGEVLGRTTSFVLPQAPIVVYSLSIRLSGDATLREHMCEQDFEPFLRPVDFYARVPDSTTGGWWGAGYHVLEHGAYEFGTGFTSLYGATWQFLDDARGEIRLTASVHPYVDGCWVLGENSEATVDEAVLVIDATFPIPVERETWGRIKALYSSEFDDGGAEHN